MASFLTRVLDPERMSRYSYPMSKQGWLQCTSVVRGMFRDELAVVVSGGKGVELSYFVPSKDVDQQHCRVRVDVSQTGTQLWVTLPTPEQTTIPVPRSDVLML